jgi:heat shock protein HslJ
MSQNEQAVLAGGGTDRSASMRLRPRWLSVLAACVLLVMVLGACGDDDDDSAGADAAASPPADQALAGTSWTLQSTATNGSSTPAAASATLRFDADGTTLSGSTGCNQFTGTYQQTGSNLTLKMGATTTAACTDAAATAQEMAILTGLPKVASFTTGAQLVLKDSSGATLFTYEPGRTTLAGSSWKATGINDGKSAVVTTAATEQVTATFGTDGTISGFAGCNNYNGPFVESNGSGLTIGPLAVTKKACEGEAATVEDAYLAALAKVAKFEIAGDQLTLRDAGGSTQVTYAAA